MQFRANGSNLASTGQRWDVVTGSRAVRTSDEYFGLDTLPVAATTIAAPLETTQLLAAVGSADPVEANKTLAVTSADPVEANQKLAAVGNADPVEANQKLAAVGSPDPLEAPQKLAVTLVEPLEATKKLAITGAEAVEALQTLAGSAAPFSTSVLDTFTRANDSTGMGGNWLRLHPGGSLGYNSPLGIISNQGYDNQNGSPNKAAYYYNSVFTGAVETYMTVPVLPGDWFGFALRGANPDGSSVKFYTCMAQSSGSWWISRLDSASSEAALASGTAGTWSNGDKIGARISNNGSNNVVIELWQKHGASDWTMLATYTDTGGSRLTADGYNGVVFGNSAGESVGRFDDFAAGSYTSGGGAISTNIDAPQKLAIAAAADPLEANKTLAVTSADPVDATKTLTVAGAADPVEANLKIVTVGNADPVEANQKLAATLAEPLDATQKLALTGSSTADATQKLAAVGNADPVEANLKLAAVGSTDPVEANQKLAATAAEPLDATQKLAVTLVEPLEALQKVGVSAGSFSSTAIGDSPTHFYKLWDSSGTTAADSSGNARDATYSGSPTLGVTGAGLDVDAAAKEVTLNGSTQYISRANESSLHSSIWTFEIVVRVDSGSGTFRAIATTRDENNNNGWLLYANDSNTFDFRHGAGGTVVLADNAFTHGVAYHVVFGHDGTKFFMYVNGVKQTSNPTGSYTAAAATALNVGRRGDNSFYAPITVQHAAHYNGALNATQISAHYNALTGSGAIIGARTTLSFETLGAVTQTAQLPLDAQKKLAIAAGADPLEANLALTRTASLPFSALAKLAATASEPFESAAPAGVISATASFPLETTQKLALTGTTAAESLKKLTGTSTLPLAALLGLRAIGPADPLDTLQKLAILGPEPLETLKTVWSNPVVSYDSFDRSQAAATTWGTTDHGEAWVNYGSNTSIYSINGSAAVIAAGSTGLNTGQTLPLAIVDQELLVKVALSAVPVGNSSTPSVMLRFTDANNHERVFLSFGTNGSVTLFMQKVVAGAATVLTNSLSGGANPTIVASGYTPGSFIWLRAQASGTTLSARAWTDGSAEPSSWQYVVSEPSVPADKPAGVGLRAFHNSGVSNFPTMSFDAFSVKQLTAEPVEAGKGIAAIGSLEPLEAAKGIAALAADPVDTWGRLAATGALAAESLKPVTGSTVTLPLAALLGLRTIGPAEPLDTLQKLAVTRAVQVDALALLKLLAATAAESTAPVRTVGSTEPLDTQRPVGSVSQAGQVPIDTTALLKLLAPAVAESTAPVRVVAVLAAEAGQRLGTSATSNVDFYIFRLRGTVLLLDAAVYRAALSDALGPVVVLESGPAVTAQLTDAASSPLVSDQPAESLNLGDSTDSH